MDTLANREFGLSVRGRIRGLDGLRAISLLLVLLAHWAPLAFLVLEWGRSGLLIFFVISGFLITRILIDLAGRKREVGGLQLLKGFYGRRFFRIQPIYYLALVFIICIGLNGAVREDVIYHVFFVQNLGNALLRNDIGSYGPAAPWWSLAVEEQFYVFWAPIVIFLRPKAGSFRYVAPLWLQSAGALSPGMPISARRVSSLHSETWTRWLRVQQSPSSHRRAGSRPNCRAVSQL